MKEREIPMAEVQAMLGPDSKRPLSRLLVMFPNLKCLNCTDESGSPYVFRADYGGMHGETQAISSLPTNLIDVLVEMTSNLIDVVHGYGHDSLN
ncbi:hypothetical protein [Deinococcus sp. UYEF24]